MASFQIGKLRHCYIKGLAPLGIINFNFLLFINKGILARLIIFDLVPVYCAVLHYLHQIMKTGLSAPSLSSFCRASWRRSSQGRFDYKNERTSISWNLILWTKWHTQASLLEIWCASLISKLVISTRERKGKKLRKHTFVVAQAAMSHIILPKLTSHFYELFFQLCSDF